MIPGQEKRTTAQSRGLRLDDIEHHLGGNGGVDGAAAFAQGCKPGFGGERVCRHHHVPLRLGECLLSEAARAFRTVIGSGVRGSAEGEDKSQRDGKQNTWSGLHHAGSIAGFRRVATYLSFL